MGALDIYVRAEFRAAGMTRAIGSMSEPFRHSSAGKAEFDTAGSQMLRTEGIPVQPGTSYILWDWADFPVDPEMFVVTPSALAYFFMLADKPTSTSNQTPLLTHLHWNQYSGSGGMPAIIPGRKFLVTPTATDPTGDSSGKPALPGLGTVAEGRAYKLACYNPNDEIIYVDLAIFT